MSSLVQHVVVAGLDVGTGLEAEEEPRRRQPLNKTSSSSDLLEGAEASKSPLATSFKAKMLQLLPADADWGDLNADVVAKLMLPQGLRFCTQPTEPQTHSFVVTREDGAKRCGVAIAFCEPVLDADVLQAVNTLQAMHVASNNNNNEENERSDRPTSTSSRRKERLVNSARSRSLPRHYQQMRLKQVDIDCKVKKSSKKKSGKFDFQQDTLYVNKAVALILTKPLVSAAKRVLHALLSYVQKKDADIKTLESLISWLLFELCTPPCGRSLRLSFLDANLVVSLPRTPRELPLFDHSLMEFFDVLGVDNAVKLVVCVLLEHQVVVYSRSLDSLMLVCESTVALLYPFSWPHVYVPILPPDLEHFLDAPVPYIMGLLRRSHDVELSKRGTMCIVDIDNGELELPEELPLLPFESEIAESIREQIIKYGGKEGATMLMEHAIESRDMLESSLNDEEVQQAADADSLQTLNEVIARIEKISATTSQHIDTAKADMRVSNAIREIFLNHMCHLMLCFEDFVISDDDSLLLTPQQQETAQNFDRTSFLTDQPRATLPFLSRFVESQMFSSFIDAYIAQKKSEEQEKTAFEIRFDALKDRLGGSISHFSSFEKCDELIDRSDKLLCHRLKKIESHVSAPKKDDFAYSTLQDQDEYVNNAHFFLKGIFPLLDSRRFVCNVRSAASKPKRLWSKDSNRSQSVDPNSSESNQFFSSKATSNSKLSMLNAYNSAAIAKTNYDFVEQLLNECRQKTKRILVEKLGSEASDWGHNNEDYKGVEESMLVFSVSDLIERIFGHGLNGRNGKSSLWQFIYKAGRSREKSIRFKNALGRHAFLDAFIRSKPVLLPDKSRNTQVLLSPSNNSNENGDELEPLVMAHNVATMHDIKTDIGFARAWIRLALERKQLSHYLLCLVRDAALLRSMYKRYAFVRSEEEREQAFHYMQTLNTVDFSCFTNAYPDAKMLYQVLLFPSQRSGQPVNSPNQLWLQLFGHHGKSEILQVPDGVIHFSFWSPNVGMVSSLRLGIGMGQETLIEHVLIRNEFTKHVHVFACGRWLGKQVDDNSNERCLFNTFKDDGSKDNMPQLLKECMMPPKNCWPPLPMRMSDPQDQVVELQTMLGDSVNRIVKYHHRSLAEKTSHTLLMCAPNGLVHSLLNAFSFGFKSARLFSRNLCVWDFLLKVTMDFNQSLGSLLASNSPPASPQPSPRREGNPRRNLSVGNLIDSPKRRVSDTTPVKNPVNNVAMTATLSRANQFRRMYTKLITRIETTCETLGKDDKFQLFVCLAAYDRLLGKIVTDLAKAIAAQQLYEEYSFLRTPSLMSFLSELLRALDDISIPVDPALTFALERSL